MRVKVVAFARVRELLGFGERIVELPAAGSAADLWNELCARCEALRPLTESTRIARNGRLVERAEKLEDGDEVALLPPAGGG